MTAMLLVLFIFYFTASLIGIVCVIQENILYSKKEKVLKILFIIFVPMIGATVEMYLLSRDITFRDDIFKDDVDKNARVYKFFDDHTLEVPINPSDSNPL